MVKVICNDYAANGYTKQPINYIFIVYAEFDNESRVAGYDLLSNPATILLGSKAKREEKMDNTKLLRYSLQLSMLKQLLQLKLISEKEYQLIEKTIKKDYSVVSSITT